MARIRRRWRRCAASRTPPAALGRSPQAVTRAVAALEARLGTRLLHRTTRSVSLTSDGRALPRAQPPRDRRARRARVADRRRTRRCAARCRSPRRCCSASCTSCRSSRAFLGAHEHVTSSSRCSIASSRSPRRASISPCASASSPDSALHRAPRRPRRTVVVASPDYLERAGTPRTPDRSRKHACIAFSATTPIADRWAFGRARVAVTPRLVVNTAQAAIDAAVGGLGITRVLSYQVDRARRGRQARIVLASHEPPAVPVQLVHLPGVQSRAAIAFAELAATTLRKQLRLSRGRAPWRPRLVLLGRTALVDGQGTRARRRPRPRQSRASGRRIDGVSPVRRALASANAFSPCHGSSPVRSS